jgi:hypothetical protein
MKFDKPADSFASAKPKAKGLENLTEAQVFDLANRFQDRRAREEAERRSDRGDKAMQARIGRLFRGLLGEIEGSVRPDRRRSWRPEAARSLTVEELAQMYAERPTRLSPEAARRREAADVSL